METESNISSHTQEGRNPSGQQEDNTREDVQDAEAVEVNPEVMGGWTAKRY
jgi:hypothetical protein